jgi:hypothetical protein
MSIRFYRPYYDWKPEWTEEQVIWLSDFLINKITPALFYLKKCVEYMPQVEEGIKGLEGVERFVRNIGNVD